MDEQLLAQAKQAAAQTGRTLTAVFEDALREVLARRETDQTKQSVELPALKLGSVRPGIDLDNSAALWELMDTDHAAD